MDLWVFDVDETLMRSYPAYMACRHEAVALIQEHLGGTGLADGEVLNLMKRKDKALMEFRRFHPSRFPSSLAHTYMSLTAMFKRPASLGVCEELLRIGRKVFDPARYQRDIIPGALELVRKLAARGHRTVFLTKGDRGVQQEKLDALRAAGFFPHDQVIVEDDKAFELKHQLGVFEKIAGKGLAYSVGDNYDNEIRPALALGYRGVWIKVNNNVTDDQRSEHEAHAKANGVRVITSVVELLT